MNKPIRVDEIVIKEEGKGLSSNDFTTEYKTKITTTETDLKNHIESANPHKTKLSDLTDVIDGKIPSSYFPEGISTSVFIVNSKDELITLTNAVKGNIAINNTDDSCYILKADPYSDAANWIELGGSGFTPKPDNDTMIKDPETGYVEVKAMKGSKGIVTADETKEAITITYLD